jgi:hypothetical protein
MDPRKVSAEFAAYVWFSQWSDESAPAEEEAVRLARANWRAFLPCAHEGLGRLLIRIAGGGAKAGRPARPRGRRGQTAAVREQACAG